MAISRRLRFEILRRDGHTCRYCGSMAPDVPLTVDHVIPTALGGSDEPTNLVTACQPCNAGKSSIAPDAEIVEDVAADALRWSRAMQKAQELRAVDRYLADSLCDQFLKEWNRWTYGGDDLDEKGERIRVHFELPNDWRSSIERLINNGLNPNEFARLVDQAMSAYRVKDEFKYFCGLAWRNVSDLQEDARRLIESETTE